MKKCVIIFFATLLMAALLTGCACEHDWKDADCVTAKTCSLCGETEGAPLGHSWKAADCLTAKTCENCGETQGEALGHSWKDATCEAPKTCENCHLTEGEALGHTWQDATTETPKTCSACGATEGERIITDERFTTAACQEVFGTWTGTMLFDGEAELGISVEGEDLTFNAIFTYTFYNDGTVTAQCAMEEESFFRVLRAVTIEEMYVVFEMEDVTREEADILFFSAYGVTVEEYVDMALEEMSIEDFTEVMEGVYYVSGGCIYMGDGWQELTEEYTYTLEGDTMVMTDSYGDTLTLTKQP